VDAGDLKCITYTAVEKRKKRKKKEGSRSSPL
jgi:hypothetical protein